MTNENNIYWLTIGNTKKLATINLDTRNSVFQEQSVRRNGREYIIWNPYRSKLAAAIMNGLEIFPFLKKTTVLYHNNCEITLAHISNIVGKEGEIHFINNSSQTTKGIQKILKRSNITLINRNIEELNKNISKKFDVIFSSINNMNQLNLLIQICKNHLKQNGYLIIIFKTKDVKTQVPPSEIRDLTHQLESTFQIIQLINLADYYKQQSVLLAKFDN